MRYIGILLMAGTLMAGGFVAAERWKKRLDILCHLRQMVYHLKSQILYMNASLPEALHQTGMKFGNEEADFFKETARRLKKEREKEFAGIWSEEAEKMFQKMPMAQQDKENLLALGKQLGYADRSMQERIFLFYLEQTDDSIARLKKDLEGKTRLFRCLGMTAGLFLMILLA